MQQEVTSPSTGPVPLTVRDWSLAIAREDKTRQLAMWLFMTLLIRTAIAAPIRAYAPVLWYMPDLAMLIAFAAFLSYGLRFNVVKALIFVLAVVLLVGYALLTNPVVAVVLQTRQFGYILLACLVGMGVRSTSLTVQRAIVIIGVVAIVGVYIDYFFKVPWAGAIFSGGLQPAEVSKEWLSDNGVRRLSGFGISSTDTSALIAVGCISACALIKNRLLGIVYCLCAVHALLLTTQKATAGWLFIVVGIYYAPAVLLRRRGDSKSASLMALKTLAIVGLICVILVPVLAFQLRLGEIIGVHAPTLDQRTAEVWPTIIPLLLKFPQSLLGYGMGAIGSTATNPDLALCDNMFLYVALSFGIPIALGVFFVGGVGLWKAPLRPDSDSYTLAVAAMLILNGITANVLGAGGVNGTYLGFAIGLLLRPKPQVRFRTPPSTGRGRRTRPGVKIGP